MMAILLERFWLLLGLGVVLSVFSFMRAIDRRTKFWLIAAKVVPAVFLVLVVINLRVVTDREALKRQLDRLVTVCENGDTVALGALMDKDFSASGMDKDQLLAAVHDIFRRLKIEQVRFSDVQVNPPPPVIKVASYAHIVSKSGADFSWIRSDWELTFRKNGDTWMLFEVRPIGLMAQPVKDIREVLNASRGVN